MRNLFIFAVTVAALAGGYIAYRHFHHIVSPESFLVEKGFVKESPPSGRSLVVFVHGVFGSGASTWLAPGRPELPNMLANDPNLTNKIDVLVYQYNTPKFGKAGRISEVADGLADFLDYKDVWNKYKKVIFIGHSMGGLVIRQLLISRPMHASQVPLIYLYATPTDGAEIANVANKISGNPQLDGMIPLEAGVYLDSVDKNWTNNPNLNTIPTYCSYEGLDTFGVRIVSQSSASALCIKATFQYANHLTIVDPESSADPRYYVMESRVATALTPSPTADQQTATAESNPVATSKHKTSSPPRSDKKPGSIEPDSGQHPVPAQTSLASATTQAQQGGERVVEPVVKPSSPPMLDTHLEITPQLVVQSLRRHISAERFPHSKQNNYWYIWLDLPDAVKDEVKDATYTFDADYIPGPVEALVNPSRGTARFGASACDQSGRVIVELQNKQPIAADFDLCKVKNITDANAIPR
ncbi:MAG: alpha/beta fold hydrolase [Acidobacteriota bacterium]